MSLRVDQCTSIHEPSGDRCRLAAGHRFAPHVTLGGAEWPLERRVQDGTGTDAQVMADWRQRALDAEAALLAMLAGDVTLVRHAPTPGIGLDYSYVPATPEVLATLSDLMKRTA